MPQLLQTLYSTVQHIFVQIPDLRAFVQNRERLTPYDPDDVTIKLAEAEDYQRLAETMDKFRTSTRLADRMARGDVCVVAYKHGMLAHFRWAAVSSLPAWGGHIVHLDPDEAYTYDGYTVPAFRRQGISSEAKVYQLTYLAQQGFRCVYSDTRVDNVNTQHARIKWVREDRARILGVISITKRFGQTYCAFTAETTEARSLIARLYRLSLHQVQVRSIDQFLDEKQP
jgi:hypothetical protein